MQGPRRPGRQRRLRHETGAGPQRRRLHSGRDCRHASFGGLNVALWGGQPLRRRRFGALGEVSTVVYEREAAKYFAFRL